MKLEDVKVGMRVHDQYGNEYKVLSVALKDAQCVELECIDFKHHVHVGGGTYFEGTGQAWWIVRDTECIRQALSVVEEIAAYEADYQKWLVLSEDEPLDVDITLETLEVVCN